MKPVAISRKNEIVKAVFDNFFPIPITTRAGQNLVFEWFDFESEYRVEADR